jgi:hypothetical protein
MIEWGVRKIIVVIVCLIIVSFSSWRVYQIVKNETKNSGGKCLTKKITSFDCGGGIPTYGCPHLIDVDWDEGKSCKTGSDCCSGMCQVLKEGNVCRTYIECWGGDLEYINKLGLVKKVSQCVR